MTIGSIKLEWIHFYRTCIAVTNILLRHKMWVLVFHSFFHFILFGANLKFKFKFTRWCEWKIYHVLPTELWIRTWSKLSWKLNLLCSYNVPSLDVFQKWNFFQKKNFHLFICGFHLSHICSGCLTVGERKK